MWTFSTFGDFYIDVEWLTSFMEEAFNLLACSLTLRTNYRCFESLNINVEVAKCGKYSQIHPVHSLLSITKNDLSWLNNPFMASFNSLVCPPMLRTNNRCVESLNISVMSPYVENIHKFTQYTDYLSVTKKLSWLNNLFMVMFQLIKMSSYAKNKDVLSHWTSV